MHTVAYEYVPLSFLFSSGLLRLLIKSAPYMGLVDRPDERKVHEGAIPVVGGLAVSATLLVMLTIAYGSTYWDLLAGTTVLTLLGVVDDRRGLKATTKLLVQALLVSALFGAGQMQISNLGDLFGTGHRIELELLALPFTVFAVVGVINAVNMIDGADGLAGGVVFISIAWFLVASMLASGQVSVALFGTMLAAIAGFLAFNMRSPWRRRAACFLGDAGSLALGFALAWIAVELTQEQSARRIPAVVALWVVGLPIMDTLSLMLRRLAKGRSPVSADRDHLHHILLRAGYSHGQMVAILLLISAIFGAVGVIGHYAGLSDATLFYSYLALAFAYHQAMMHAWRLAVLLRRNAQPAENPPAASQPVHAENPVRER